MAVNGKVSILAGGALLLTVLGFVAGMGLRAGAYEQRLKQIEETFAAHIEWSQKRSEVLDHTLTAASNASLATQQMAGDIQQMQHDLREIRDYWLSHRGAQADNDR